MKFSLCCEKYLQATYDAKSDCWLIEDNQKNLFPLSFATEHKAIEACLIISSFESWDKKIEEKNE